MAAEALAFTEGAASVLLPDSAVAADALGCGRKVAAAAACAPLFAAAVADVACVADSAAGLVGAGTCADSVAPPALLAPLAAVPPVAATPDLALWVAAALLDWSVSREVSPAAAAS